MLKVSLGSKTNMIGTFVCIYWGGRVEGKWKTNFRSNLFIE